MTKEFVTAAREASKDAAPDEGPIEFTLDGVTMTAHRPSEGQIALLMAATGDYSEAPEAVSTFINFFFQILDDEAKAVIKRRLFDAEDDFEIQQIIEIIEWLVGEWSARPTKQPSDFMPSRTSDGRRSTVKRHSKASIPSDSVPIASAT